MWARLRFNRSSCRIRRATQIGATLTAVASTSIITAGGLVGAAVQPEVGDYILVTNGPAVGQVRRIIAYNATNGPDDARHSAPESAVDRQYASRSRKSRRRRSRSVSSNRCRTIATRSPSATDLVDPAGNKLDGESNAARAAGRPAVPQRRRRAGRQLCGPLHDRQPAGNRQLRLAAHQHRHQRQLHLGSSRRCRSAATRPTSTCRSRCRCRTPNGTVGPGGFNVHDLLFAGKFFAPKQNGNTRSVTSINWPPSDFRTSWTSYRWIIDTNSDGVVTVGTDIITAQPTAG